MASENNIILNIPFDETAGSTTAYDYSSNRADGSVIDADFVAGKQGNCIKFDGGGHCDIERNIIPLTGNFSILAWLKRSAFPDGFTGKRIGIFARWDDINGYSEEWFNLNADYWGYWAIVKEGLKISIYLDTQLVKTITLPAQPTGFALLQDIYSTQYGYGCIDDVKAYNVALTTVEIAESISSVAQLAYSIDGTDFKNWNISVSESNGLLDRPKLKSPLSVDWADYHGEVIDLQSKRVEAREISLNCFMKATGKVDFVTKLNDFLDVFSKDGTQRLMVDIHPTKPLVYEVYNENGIVISKRWNDDIMVGTFTLKLKEPDPVKRVIRHQRISDTTKTLSITLTTTKVVTIHWGDGTKSEDIYGTEVTVTHTYTNNGIFYAIVAGVIENIESFTTNGIVVWNKL
ncbi:MAG: LamG-like jellyroll fold domain-containing protein [Bacteroidaceae bacterium]